MKKKKFVTKSRYLFQNSCTCDKTGGMKKIVRAMLVSWKERERSGRERGCWRKKNDIVIKKNKEKKIRK